MSFFEGSGGSFTLREIGVIGGNAIDYLRLMAGYLSASPAIGMAIAIALTILAITGASHVAPRAYRAGRRSPRERRDAPSLAGLSGSLLFRSFRSRGLAAGLRRPSCGHAIQLARDSRLFYRWENTVAAMALVLVVVRPAFDSRRSDRRARGGTCSNDLDAEFLVARQLVVPRCDGALDASIDVA